jgi:2'-5' RNA ligase
MRAFIAVELSDEVRAAFSRLQEKFRGSGADVKWVKPGNAHLTLKFMAEVSDADAESVKAILDEIGGKTKPFSIRFSGLGFFPSERRPRVLWVGISEGSEDLKRLATSIDEGVSSLGIPKENRPFSPHLTLGRFKSNRNLNELLSLVTKAKDFDAGELAGNEMHLIQSVLSRTGPTYTTLHTAAFTAE